MSLDWPLDRPGGGFNGRDGLRWEMRRREGKEGDKERCVNDDVVRLDTQGSSQWDGMRHYGG